MTHEGRQLNTGAVPIIETDRLILRAPQMSDLPRMTAFFATSRSHMVGGPRDEPETFRTLTSRLGHWMLRGYGMWHFHTKADERFMGWAGLMYAPGWHEPELGWTVMEDGEGKGLASEAVTAARAYAARHQALDALMSYIAPANARSRAMAIRLGATFERKAELLGMSCDIYRHPRQEAA